MSTAKRLLGWRSRKQSHDSSAGRLVSHGGSALGSGDGHELDEIAVVSSNADPCHVKYGSGPLSTINGPRLVPGKIYDYTTAGNCKSLPFVLHASFRRNI
ncbi:hypothetical protein Trydic_g8032 [Trypoxylus dichotomus]